MNLTKMLERLVAILKPTSEDRSMISMVLLLRKPVFASEARIRSAAQRAFDLAVDGETASEHFVMRSGDKSVLRLAPHLITLFNGLLPYYGDASREFSKRLPQASQREAWDEHHAWTALDYAGGGADAELAYCILSKIAAELLDSNCTGVHVPGESSFIPNDASLYDELRRMAASRVIEFQKKA